MDFQLNNRNISEVAVERETSQTFISKDQKVTKSSQHLEEHNYFAVVPNYEQSYSCHHGEADYMQIREPDDLDSLRSCEIAEQLDWFRSNLDPFYPCHFQSSSNVEQEDLDRVDDDNEEVDVDTDNGDDNEGSESEVEDEDGIPPSGIKSLLFMLVGESDDEETNI